MQNSTYDYNRIKAELNDIIFSLADNKADKICIFGAGKRGIKLCKELHSRFVNVSFFCDNGSEKIGANIDGVKIIAFDELMKQKDETIVIISVADGAAVSSQLSEAAFPYVYQMSDIQRIYSDIPPIKWLKEFDGKIDYTDENTIKLINVFKRTILDICSYYENI